MKKPTVVMTIMKEDTGYSAHTNVGTDFIGTQGETFDELKTMILDAVNLTYKERGFVYTIGEIRFVYDMYSFFNFYKVINAKALSERIGINQSLLAQYIKGSKKPSIKQTRRILDGVHQIGRDLTEVQLLV